MIQFLRKLFRLDTRVTSDAPLDMHIGLDLVETPMPAKTIAKTPKAPAKKQALPKKENAVTADKPASARKGRPKKA
jgi:hypothetical protein